jgi:predicted ATPase
MKHTFSITGFKCFKEKADFDINKLTILTGSNGKGKSSVIQALLLTRLAIEKNLQSTIVGDYNADNWRGLLTPLNNGYELALGTDFDVFNSDLKSENKIQLSLDNDSFEIPLPGNKSSTAVDLKQITKSSSVPIPFWLRKEFYYLNAERLGPRHSATVMFTEFIHCGSRGEYTAQVILDNSFFKVQDERHVKEEKSNFLPQQVDGWLDFICPGMKVKPVALGDLNAQVRILNSANKEPMLATNIGFGVSYVLPIIVTGLIAVEGAMLVVENPEAHLHPKGQSNVGFFLGKIAASGVNVMVETHSEHVINGFRKAFLSVKNLASDDISIYFFDGPLENNRLAQPITINPEGDLRPFPRDFFDQVHQDFAEIFQLRNKKKNGESTDL